MQDRIACDVLAGFATQQNANRGIVALFAFEFIVHPNIHINLADILMGDRAHFQINQNIAFQFDVIEHKVYLDDKKNIMVCPIPYDGSFMELFYTSWGIVQQFIAADAQMPREVSLPVPADRQAVKELVVRREFPIVDVVDALEPLAQPNLTEQINQTVDLVTTKEGESILNNAIIAPVASLS